jgi:hypothetical protein
VEHARILALPSETPLIMVAASKPRAADLAGRCSDGLISFEPDQAVVRRFEKSGGKGKPRFGQLTVCYAQTKEKAESIVRKYWPNAGIGGDLMTDLPLPTHFDEIKRSCDQRKLRKGSRWDLIRRIIWRRSRNSSMPDSIMYMCIKSDQIRRTFSAFIPIRFFRSSKSNLQPRKGSSQLADVYSGCHKAATMLGAAAPASPGRAFRVRDDGWDLEAADQRGKRGVYGVIRLF